jgi:hypothetical protein
MQAVPDKVVLSSINRPKGGKRAGRRVGEI